MAAIHISEAEAARDLAALLARVRAGAEVVIDDDASLAVVLGVASDRPVRRLSKSLRLAKEHGSTVTLDGGFAHDLEAVINGHPVPLKSSWDRSSTPASLSLPSVEEIQSRS
jgi:antitoxin (DNA-binding transcriptional repressor) of toxin-antitoxin stability system